MTMRLLLIAVIERQVLANARFAERHGVRRACSPTSGPIPWPKGSLGDTVGQHAGHLGDVRRRA